MRLLIAAAALALLGTAALAQHTHEGDVGSFYETWLRPNMRQADGARYSSCCNRQDCTAILEMRKHPGGLLHPPYQPEQPAMWEVLLSVPWSAVPQWVAVLDSIWEDNQIDPRESPDGRTHACVTYSGMVICAVRSSGQ